MKSNVVHKNGFRLPWKLWNQVGQKLYKRCFVEGFIHTIVWDNTNRWMNNHNNRISFTFWYRNCLGLLTTGKITIIRVSNVAKRHLVQTIWSSENLSRSSLNSRNRCCRSKGLLGLTQCELKRLLEILQRFRTRYNVVNEGKILCRRFKVVCTCLRSQKTTCSSWNKFFTFSSRSGYLCRRFVRFFRFVFTFDDSSQTTPLDTWFANLGNQSSLPKTFNTVVNIQCFDHFTCRIGSRIHLYLFLGHPRVKRKHINDNDDVSINVWPV